VWACLDLVHNCGLDLSSLLLRRQRAVGGELLQQRAVDLDGGVLGVELGDHGRLDELRGLGHVLGRVKHRVVACRPQAGMDLHELGVVAEVVAEAGVRRERLVDGAGQTEALVELVAELFVGHPS
jgi:hypothetical protein